MSHSVQPEPLIPATRFALILGIVCLCLVTAVAAIAKWDASRRSLIESTEITVIPDEEQFFPAPADLKAGLEVAKMDRRKLYLAAVGTVSYSDDLVMATGLDDTRIYPIYQLKSPQGEDKPNYLLLKTAPETYLEISDRWEAR